MGSVPYGLGLHDSKQGGPEPCVPILDASRASSVNATWAASQSSIDVFHRCGLVHLQAIDLDALQM